MLGLTQFDLVSLAGVECVFMIIEEGNKRQERIFKDHKRSLDTNEMMCDEGK